MRYARIFTRLAGIAVVVIAPAALLAQHAEHERGEKPPADSGMRVHVMAQALPLITRATPTAGGVTRTEVALAQTLVMSRAAWWRDHVILDATLDLEGLTMGGGELSTGAFGEGYVDRRHPHTYLHELMLTAARDFGPVAASVTAGRGFAPFGTDDPMVRPFAKYPVNHHLAQILERGIVLGAARLGPLIAEGGAFTGEEPTSPSTLPRARRFADSWSVRGTVLPAPWMEVQGSYARVASPEEPGGFGLDQRKRSASVRATTPGASRMLLVEWARTVEHDHDSGLDAFAYESALVEGAVRAGGISLALRLEQTELPEEERTADPVRTGRPATDLSIAGITRWRIATLNVAAAAVTHSTVSGVPFLEVSRLAVSSRNASALFVPERFYGQSRLWMLSLGLRLRAGAPHERMGRYGVALPPSADHLH